VWAFPLVLFHGFVALALSVLLWACKLDDVADIGWVAVFAPLWSSWVLYGTLVTCLLVVGWPNATALDPLAANGWCHRWSWLVTHNALLVGLVITEPWLLLVAWQLADSDGGHARVSIWLTVVTAVAATCAAGLALRARRAGVDLKMGYHIGWLWIMVCVAVPLALYVDALAADPVVALSNMALGYVFPWLVLGECVVLVHYVCNVRAGRLGLEWWDVPWRARSDDAFRREWRPWHRIAGQVLDIVYGVLLTGFLFAVVLHSAVGPRQWLLTVAPGVLVCLMQYADRVAVSVVHRRSETRVASPV